MSEVSESIPFTPSSSSYYLDYIAKANGYVVFSGNTNSSTKMLLIHQSTVGMITATSGTYYQSVYLPVYAGQTVKFDAANYSTVSSIKFYYTVGEAKRLGLL